MKYECTKRCCFIEFIMYLFNKNPVGFGGSGILRAIEEKDFHLKGEGYHR